MRSMNLFAGDSLFNCGDPIFQYSTNLSSVIDCATKCGRSTSLPLTESPCHALTGEARSIINTAKMRRRMNQVKELGRIDLNRDRYIYLRLSAPSAANSVSATDYAYGSEVI
jgi:hypothetical protein